MRVLFLILALMLMPSAADKLSCFVGVGNTNVVKENFKICTTTYNTSTRSIRYGGLKENSMSSVKGMYQFRVADCTLNVKRSGAARLECWCVEDRCNEPVSPRAFERIINHQSRTSYEGRIS
ncbi:hypothetical protein CAEBREN_24394 [Caenorhabditis brenneri]|uniref:Uncharacterized protein n=1 Tax=Caenorhabditis brenneri TaxID=135651 RepID=G0PFB6_CAEBE|nr:hypothetical protein CAEBREN_24394 [Caenorhabditis brenneri]